MNKPKPYDLNLVKITNHAKVLAIQERKFHKHQKTKTMSKEYIGSQEEIEQQISQQIQAYEHLNMIVDVHFKKHFVDVFTMSNNEGKYILTRDELIEILSVLLKC